MDSVEQLRMELLKLNIQNTHFSDIEPFQPQLQAVLHQPELCVPLLDPLLKILPCNDARVKELVYSSLVRVCPHVPDSPYLMVNQLQKDVKDPNPAVRSVAVMFISCSKILAGMGKKTLQSAFQDCSSCVRRSVVAGCRNIFSHSPKMLVDDGFINQLYSAIADADPVVVALSLQTLDFVLANEGGVVITRSMSVHLLKMLEAFNTEDRISVMLILKRCKPPSDQDEPLTQYMERYIVSNDKNVVLPAVQLAIHLSQNQKNKYLHYYEMGFKSLLIHTDFASSEWMCKLISFLKEVDSRWLEPFQRKIIRFYPLRIDTIPHIKQKLEFLPQLINEENANDASKQVLEICYHKNLAISNGIQCLYMMAQCNSSALKCCVTRLLLLFKTAPYPEKHQILSTLISLKSYGFVPEEFMDVIEHVFESFRLDFANTDINPLLIWTLGQFGHGSKTAYSNIRHLVQNYFSYEYEVRTSILEATLKLHARSDAEYEYHLRKVLDQAKDDQLYTCRRAKVYIQLLTSNPVELKTLMLASIERALPPSS